MAADKKKDQFSEDADILKKDRSVKSGKKSEELISPSLLSDLKKLNGITKSPFPHKIKPMLAHLSKEAFNNQNWIFEIKWDGYRAIAEIENGQVQLYSRNFTSFNELFSPISEALSTIHHNAVIDGEIVVVDKEGISRFRVNIILMC